MCLYFVHCKIYICLKGTIMSENKTNKAYSLKHHYDLYVKLKAMKQSMGSNSLRGKYDEFYPLFLKAFEQHKTMAMQLLFMLRDINGGLGERELFRKTLLDLEKNDPKLIIKVLRLIPKYGRWDDLMIFQNPKVQFQAIRIIARGLKNPKTKGLVSKWLPRKPKNQTERVLLTRLRSFLKLTPKQFRQLLVSNCKEAEVVEQYMCAKQWDKITYKLVPSSAMKTYYNTFKKQDGKRFQEYLNETLGNKKPASTLNIKNNEKLELKHYSDVWTAIQKPKKHHNNKKSKSSI